MSVVGNAVVVVVCVRLRVVFLVFCIRGWRISLSKLLTLFFIFTLKKFRIFSLPFFLSYKKFLFIKYKKKFLYIELSFSSKCEK